MLFSVLIPIYFKENPEFLINSLNSILLNQTIKPAEVVVVKDGKLTSELNAILDQFVSIYPNQIKIYGLNENMGMGYAMNYGLHKCAHEWIFRMDSDDVAKPHRFEEQLKIIETNEYDVIGSAIIEFSSSLGDLKQLRVMPQNHTDIIKFMKFRNPINHMTVAFKKSVAIKANGYWDKRFFEDYNLWYEMFKVGAKFHNIQEPLVDARIGNNMVSRRRGYAYFKYEKILMRKFLIESFITLLEYYFYLFIKLILRILPLSVLSYIYKKLLRQSI